LEVQDGSPGPDDALQAKQARSTVLRALERIPLRRRAVLVMHDLEEVPMAQVATTLSIPLFTAYSRLRKARIELEAAIRRIGNDASGPGR
jgi:RNA polymerase sigma-70 factor (ECF subfamily)